jgi:4-hydroxybenzoate polyprenyltransferase
MNKKLSTFLEAIKFSHSIFALPFALLAMMLAANGWPSFGKVFWIIVACVAARTAAMSFNRVIDRDVDARNPRTKTRALVTGALTPEEMILALIVSAIVFVIAAGMLNYKCLLLSPWALLILFAYSFAKRVTNYSHFLLGLALAIAPIGGWIAITGHFAFVPVVLGFGVLFWVAGFDILYACQDYDVDRRDPGLHSIPKMLGLRNALIFAKKAHLVAFISFLLVWMLSDLGWLFLLGVLGAGVLMVKQHSLVKPRDLSRINAAFFTMNGIISVGLFLLGALDIALGK